MAWCSSTASISRTSTPEQLAAVRSLQLSNSSELLLRLRWMAILEPSLKLSLAVTGGVHTALDVVKATMAGAHATQMVSALLHHGPEQLRAVLADLADTAREDHRVELARRDARQSEHLARARSGCLRTGELHADALSWRGTTA